MTRAGLQGLDDAADALKTDVMGLAGSILNGIYRVDYFVARGGMGHVYAGVNIETGDRVAIKTIPPHLAADVKTLAMFRAEARLLTRVVHPAVVPYRVFARDPTTNIHYIVTDFVDGDALSERLTGAPASLAQTLALLRRLAGGLGMIHAIGAVHCDIAPDNVLLPGGQIELAKIVDFGISQSLHPGNATVVMEGFAGKLGYVAPEQFGVGGWPIGAWTDVYSTALVTLAYSRGRASEMGKTLAEAIERRRHVPLIDDTPRVLQPLLRAMLVPDPTQRISSMADVVAALNMLENGRPSVVAEPIGLIGSAPLETDLAVLRRPFVERKNPMIRARLGQNFPGFVDRLSTSELRMGYSKAIRMGGAALCLTILTTSSSSPWTEPQTVTFVPPAPSSARYTTPLRQTGSPPLAMSGGAQTTKPAPMSALTARADIGSLKPGRDETAQVETVRNASSPPRTSTALNVNVPRKQPTSQRADQARSKAVNFAATVNKRSVCRRNNGSQWVVLGMLYASQCLRRGFAEGTTSYVMFDTNILSRHKNRIGLMTSGSWRPLARNAQLPAFRRGNKNIDRGPPSFLPAAMPRVPHAILASTDTAICRRFDGINWQRLGTMNMRLCMEQGFSQPGTGHVQSGGYVMSRRAGRIGVTHGPGWQPIAKIKDIDVGDAKISIRDL